MLYSDLKEIIEEANQLEDKIQQVLARSTIDDNYIEELNVKVTTV